MSTSRRVKATYVRDGLLTETTVSTLYDIRQNRIAEEGRIAREANATRQMRERLVEAAMELGDMGNDFDYGVDDVQANAGSDASSEEEDDDDVEMQFTPRVFSKYFKSAAQAVFTIVVSTLEPVPSAINKHGLLGKTKCLASSPNIWSGNMGIVTLTTWSMMALTMCFMWASWACSVHLNITNCFDPS
ncbi:hypothetical protein L210DRAFT_3641541 [Boletus edulis BED1]|uniref:Uncharacterized protein n=1 Tax=Boletus edulis BED1 TaxID=1328754 RepID=A0AAD4C340_BOLED|nr:hypothetical protein L210DRAFT_3641541 [Boletus edulis BED1]